MLCRRYFDERVCLYADDVALLAPTIMARNKLITLCVSFSREFHVLFNPIKSKLIACNCATTEDIYVSFDGEKIQITFQKCPPR